ncbi:glycosyltransferase family 4 protein [soil metagenome]
MNIVFIGNYNKSEVLTGPEKVAKRIFDEYIKTDKAVFLEYFQDGNTYNLSKKIFGKEIIRQTENGLILRVGVVQLFMQLIKLKPQIVHILTFERFAKLTFSLKRFLKFKVIFNLHGIVYYENTELNIVENSLSKKNYKAEKIFLNCSDVILYLSEFYLEIGKKFYELKSEKLVKIKNGVDEMFHRKESRTTYNKVLKVVFSGDIKRKDKGYNFLKEALRRTNVRIELYIIGSRKYDEYISDNIDLIFAGFLNADELSTFYKNKDIFISASLYDTFSIASAEAMSSGLTLIATDTTGISEFIEDGVNGFIIKYGDVNRLSEIISKLNTDRNLKKSISLNGERIYNELNWSEVIKDYKLVYKNILT